jgi:hypothetical protein
MLTEITDKEARLKELSEIIIPLQAQIEQLQDFIKYNRREDLKEDLKLLQNRIGSYRTAYFNLLETPVWD